MRRWQKPKPRKKRVGEQLLFPIHEDEMMPWELDEEKEEYIPPVPKVEFVPLTPPNDEIPF